MLEETDTNAGSGGRDGGRYVTDGVEYPMAYVNELLRKDRMEKEAQLRQAREDVVCLCSFTRRICDLNYAVE